MTVPDEIEIFQSPSKKLRAKLATDNPDAPPLPPSVLESMNCAVENLKDDYLREIMKDVAKLRGLFTEVDALRMARSDFVVAVGHSAMQIKSLGSTFGYSLISSVASSLAQFACARDDLRPLDISVIGTHIESLETIIRLNLTGDGGDDGRSLLIHLDQLVKKANGGT